MVDESAQRGSDGSSETRGTSEITLPSQPEATVTDGPRRPVSSPVSLERGAELGRYLIVEKLGAGAMGVVYRAYDPELDRAVALKLVATDGFGSGPKEDERARLMREAQAMARLSHPNIITVFDVGAVGEAVYVAMEFVDGETLRQFRQREHDVDEILGVFLQAGEGLAEAHRAGIVHRDFKPDNVMIERRESGFRVRVLDFGLARSIETAEAPRRGPRSHDLEGLETDPGDARDTLDRSMTLAGAVVGTPAYMSPEQFLGRKATAASDQFSFCVALFEALYDRRPFRGKNLASLSTNVVEGNVERPSPGRTIPARVRDALDRGLDTNPDRRFESMDALLTALRGRERRRRGWLIGAFVGAAMASGVAWATLPDATDAGPLCTGAQTKLTEVWNDEARNSLARGFEQTGLDYATQVWTATASILDERSEAWKQGYTDACEATHVRGEQSEDLLDRRVACYDRQLRQTQALLTALSDPDEPAVRGAIDAALALPDPSACADVDRLMAKPEANVSLGDQAELERLRERLDAVRTEIQLGRFTKVKEGFDAVVDDARKLGHGSTLVEALHLQGALATGTGEPKVGTRLLEEAFMEATAAGDDRVAADLARQLAFEWGSVVSDEPTARRWYALGRALLRRVGGDPDLDAQLWSVLGAIEVAVGNYDAALEAHEKAREHWQSVAPESPRMADVLSDIGAVLVVQGKPEDAIDLQRSAVEIKQAVYGADHPKTAGSMRELGNALSQVERFDEAVGHLQRALEIERAARGEASTRVAILLDDLGRVARAQGKLDEAIERHRQAVEVWEAALGDPHMDLAVSVLNLAYTQSAAGRFEEAHATAERALAMFQSTVGHAHGYVVYASNAAASALIDLERYDEAWTHIEQVLAMQDVQVDPTLIAETQFMGAHALWADGQAPSAARARARDLARQARDTYADGADRWKPWVERIDKWLVEHD